MERKNALHPVSLKELLDISAFRDLSESYTRLTGMPTAILDLEGEIIIASGWQRICTEFHRKNPITSSRCLESDTALANRLAKGEPYNIYKCRNGLVDVAVPIIIEDRHLGNLFAGQFFFESPDIDFFTKQAEEFNFDKGAYLDALSKVPVLSADKVKRMMNYLTNLTVVIGNSGMDKMKLMDSNLTLEQRIQERTADLKTEIEKRKKIERELKTSKQFLESVFDAIQDGISVLDRDLNVIQVNRTMSKWYPHLNDAMGKKCYAIYHERSGPCEGCPGTRTLKSKKMEMAEIPFVSKDGVPGTLELFTFPIQDDPGEIIGVVEYVRDITTRKHIEDQIKLEKSFSESLIESLPGVMYLFDQFGHFKRWNRNFEIVTGYSAGQIMEMNPLDFISTGDKPSVRKAIDQVFEKGFSDVEAELSTISGKNIPYLLTGYKYVHQDINYLVGVGLDITERIKNESEKENLINKMQETLSQVKQLSGLLPICSSCKNIRDDQGYWKQIESYIRDHSEAEFSHSMCPDCVKKLYPDLKL